MFFTFNKSFPQLRWPTVSFTESVALAALAPGRLNEFGIGLNKICEHWIKCRSLNINEFMGWIEQNIVIGLNKYPIWIK